MMNSEKRLFLAIGLSVLIILGYQMYMKQYRKPYHSSKTNDTVVQEQTRPERVLPPAAKAEKQAKAYNSSEELTTVSTNQYKAVFTSHGAGIKGFYLLQYTDSKGSPTQLYQAEAGIPVLLSLDSISALPEPDWHLAKRAANSLEYRTSTGGIEMLKRFTFYNTKYIIGLDIKILNGTNRTAQVAYHLNNGTITVTNGYLDSRYVGADMQIGSKVIRKRPSSKLVTEALQMTGSPAWVSTHGRYFSFVLKPEQDEKGAFMRSSTKQNIWSGIISNSIMLMPGQSASRSYTLYAGPSDAKAIAELGASTSNVVSYGFFHSIANLLLKGLNLLYRFTGNYGLAIILLSLTIGLALMPLTRKSLHSMKEMQKLQPEIEQIRQAYKDNPQKMNKEIMELYKKHKINPIGGCLPMLLQLPIFMSLYQVLLRSSALQNARFLWIKNLAGPDAAFTIPHKLPIIGNNINILPILMAIAMWGQQKLSQGGGKEASEQQKMMSTIMPVVFGFIFYNMPSGLVLYWFTNTLFMLVVQEVVLKARFPGKTRRQ